MRNCFDGNATRGIRNRVEEFFSSIAGVDTTTTQISPAIGRWPLLLVRNRRIDFQKLGAIQVIWHIIALFTKLLSLVEKVRLHQSEGQT